MPGSTGPGGDDNAYWHTSGDTLDKVSPRSLKVVGDTISNLGKRQFLLRRAGKDVPEVMTTRWAMSYLRGPLTRDQIPQAMAVGAAAAAPAPAAPVAPAAAKPETPMPITTARTPSHGVVRPRSSR